MEFIQFVPLLVVVGIAVALFLVFRGRRAVAVVGVPLGEPSGIGGWLILPAIAMIFGPLLAIKGVIDAATLLGNPLLIEEARPLVVFELIANVVLAGAGIFVAINFFRKKVGAPRQFIMILAAGVLVSAADLAMSVAFIPDWSVGAAIGGTLIGPLIGLAIWAAYMRTSVRVKNTFVVP